MGSLEDALKKAGLSSSDPEEPAADAAASAGETREANGKEGGDARPPRPPRPPREPKEPAAPLEEKPCTKCGAMFMPKNSKHRLCMKCADEHFAAAKEKGDKPDKPAEAAGDRPSGDKAAGPKPERRERPPRPPRLERAERPERLDRQDRQDRPGRFAPPPAPKEVPAGFPHDYLQGGYFSGTALRDELYDAWARPVAGLLVARRLSHSQLRAFHTHLKRAEASLAAGRDFTLVREDVLKMRPVAAERQGRGRIPAEFSDFLDRNLDQVRDPRSLHGFAEHFEAVVGYTAGKLRN